VKMNGAISAVCQSAAITKRERGQRTEEPFQCLRLAVSATHPTMRWVAAPSPDLPAGAPLASEC
jgi:hypothetical protein